MEMALSDFGDGMHAWSLYLKEVNNDQDKLEYNMYVNFG